MFKGQRKRRLSGIARQVTGKQSSFIPQKSRKEHFKKEVVGQLSCCREVTRRPKHIQET